jgi:outer membrane receptor protein involved in Fe transport
MKRFTAWTPAFLATSAFCLIAAPFLHAQTAPTPASGEDQEEPIVLSPFVVDAGEDTGTYRATATLAGTRIRTELRDVGSAISVVTAQFLQDTGARNTEDLLVYTTNTEVGGTAGNFSGTGGRSDTGEARLRPHENTRVRGLARADNSRDFFITDIPWDSYNVGRVDLQRGPNSILFGLGSPAGMVNASLNTASFKNANTVEARYGSFGSYRGSIDINRVLLDDELSIRVAALNDKTFYRQDPAFSHNTRGYGAIRFDPKLLRRGSARTSIRANFEKGEIGSIPQQKALRFSYDLRHVGGRSRSRRGS